VLAEAHSHLLPIEGRSMTRLILTVDTQRVVVRMISHVVEWVLVGVRINVNLFVKV